MISFSQKIELYKMFELNIETKIIADKFTIKSNTINTLRSHFNNNRT